MALTLFSPNDGLPFQEERKIVRPPLSIYYYDRKNNYYYVDCPDPFVPEERMPLWIDGLALEGVLMQLSECEPKPISIGPKLLASCQLNPMPSLFALEAIVTVQNVEPKGGILIRKFPGGFHGRRFRIASGQGETLATLSHIVKLVQQRTDRHCSMLVDDAQPSFQVRQNHRSKSPPPRRVVTKAERRFLTAVYEDEDALNDFV